MFTYAVFNKNMTLFKQASRHVFTNMAVIYANTFTGSLDDKYQLKGEQRKAALCKKYTHDAKALENKIALMWQGIEKEKTHQKEEIKKIFYHFTKHHADLFPAALKALRREQPAVDTLAKTLYGDDYQLALVEQDYSFQSTDEIKLAFTLLDKIYHYFDADREAVFAKFIGLYKMCKLILDFSESYMPQYQPEIYLAYTLLVLFGDKNNVTDIFQSVDEYLKKHNFTDHQSSTLVSVFSIPLPIDNKDGIKINLDLWRPFIMRAGTRGIQLFHMANLIEERSKEMGIPLHHEKDIFQVYSKSTFKNHEQFPELVDLLMQLNIYDKVTNADFDQCVFYNKKNKSSDNLPDCLIEGKVCGHPGFFLIKLPIGDPTAYIIGHLINCCLHVGDNAKQCVFDSVTCKNNGLYVMLKSKKKNTHHPIIQNRINHIDYEVVGAGYTWVSNNNNLTIDSWESIKTCYDAIAVDFLKYFSETVVKNAYYGIRRVTIGINSEKTPEFFTKQEEVYRRESMKEGTSYPDSNRQALIFSDDKLIELGDLIDKLNLIPMNNRKDRLIEMHASGECILGEFITDFIALERILDLVFESQVIDLLKLIGTDKLCSLIVFNIDVFRLLDRLQTKDLSLIEKLIGPKLIELFDQNIRTQHCNDFFLRCSVQHHHWYDHLTTLFKLLPVTQRVRVFEEASPDLLAGYIQYLLESDNETINSLFSEKRLKSILSAAKACQTSMETVQEIAASQTVRPLASGSGRRAVF